MPRRTQQTELWAPGELRTHAYCERCEQYRRNDQLCRGARCTALQGKMLAVTRRFAIEHELAQFPGLWRNHPTAGTKRDWPAGWWRDL